MYTSWCMKHTSWCIRWRGSFGIQTFWFCWYFQSSAKVVSKTAWMITYDTCNICDTKWPPSPHTSWCMFHTSWRMRTYQITCQVFFSSLVCVALHTSFRFYFSCRFEFLREVRLAFLCRFLHGYGMSHMLVILVTAEYAKITHT